MKEMDSEELKRMNGKDGNPVYVAFGGKVYDVTESDLWKTGVHMARHASGQVKISQRRLGQLPMALKYSISFPRLAP